MNTDMLMANRFKEDLEQLNEEICTKKMSSSEILVRQNTLMLEIMVWTFIEMKRKK